MNRQLTQDELQSLSMPIAPQPKPMTRCEKLMRFAMLVRKSKKPFAIFHGLEYQPPHHLAAINHPQSAFALAAQDDIFYKAGLRGESVYDAMKFFSLSQDELHEFSCDCGGSITNGEMADRIEGLAARRK